MLADYHVHTAFSDDSDYPMEDVVRDALALGLGELCFTEHVDYGIKQDPDRIEAPIRYLFGDPSKPLLNADCPAFLAEVARLRGLYGDRIVLRQGMEFGVQPETADRFRALFAQYDFDFVLLSIHQLGNREFWSQEFQQGRTQKEYNDAYYRGMLDVVTQYKDYSALAHMDMIRRYDAQGYYPFENNRDVIAEILRRLIADGKALEVNTSCFRYGIGDLTPASGILSLYRDLGGELLTIGSDSHKPGDLGARIGEVQARLRSMGFRAFYTYERMQPTAHALCG
ncbi:MAG: histidinol-phosphatase HisJ family protein [Oscillospiraceae bacterium]|nr:histidinol-phosphatase HisJ family protein [Oscillospiraceae bacterium]